MEQKRNNIKTVYVETMDSISELLLIISNGETRLIKKVLQWLRDGDYGSLEIKKGLDNVGSKFVDVSVTKRVRDTI